MEKNIRMKKRNLLVLLIPYVFLACNSGGNILSDDKYNALADSLKRSPAYAVEGIEVADPALELTLFASEPMMTNPTNMDIDDKGRVWICEAYNYRNKLNPRNPYRPAGDRILIMEDTDNDGKADKSKVFYQGEDINSALGIAIFGNKVYVSCSPNVLVFTDENGDDVADKKEVLFTGIGGEQHDHGMHSFTFGPDGKFYFNYGNEGKGLLTSQGKPFYDPTGRLIKAEGKPYREGMVYRMDTDGSNVEIMAWNFRNNYELALDAYGRMWQSDNDDDGNRGVRINYVMDYGNYGFKDEITGADWRTRRVNMEDSVYQQHWHLNDPGVVPNLLQTYAGSPTGIIVYEGDLLPSRYYGQMIHCDAGPNVVRAYPVTQDGAGFKAEIMNILNGNNRDKWFRPSDITVAPDGSIFIADWYDPGVGGHAMGDSTRGRIFRLAPKGHKYAPKQADYKSVEGNIAALQNPNVATRFKAWTNLHNMGTKAEQALLALYNTGESRMKARALWLLAALPEKGKDYLKLAMADPDENIRVAVVRAMREHKDNFENEWLKMTNNASPQVLRELALAIRYKNVPKIWNALANRYKGNDRWMLEALGIAADGHWDDYLDVYIEQHKNWIKEPAAADIIWRSRSKNSMNLLAQLIQQSKGKDKWRYYRALDFLPDSGKNSLLLGLLAKSNDEDEKLIIFKQLQIENLDKYPELKALLPGLLKNIKKETDFLDVVKKFSLKSEESRILSLVEKSTDGKIIVEAADVYYNLFGIDKVKQLCTQADQKKALNFIERFGSVDKSPVTNMLVALFTNKNLDLSLRSKAMEAMNGWESEEDLWELAQKNKIPEDILPIAKDILMRTWHSDIRAAAAGLFKDVEGDKIDPQKILGMNGFLDNGKVIFETYCSSCHLVKGQGVDFGPNLSQIGKKLTKEGMLNAILYPSEGIGFGYETHQITMKDGSEIQALVNSKTENELRVKLPGQAEQTLIKRADVKADKELDISMMPAFPMTEQEYADLIYYLLTLK